MTDYRSDRLGNDLADPDLSILPIRVDQYYDRHTRSWITLVINARGDQLGDSSYDGTRADAAASKRSLERRIGATTGGTR